MKTHLIVCAVLTLATATPAFGGDKRKKKSEAEQQAAATGGGAAAPMPPDLYSRTGNASGGNRSREQARAQKAQPQAQTYVAPEEQQDARKKKKR